MKLTKKYSIPYSYFEVDVLKIRKKLKTNNKVHVHQKRKGECNPLLFCFLSRQHQDKLLCSLISLPLLFFLSLLLSFSCRKFYGTLFLFFERQMRFDFYSLTSVYINLITPIFTNTYYKIL